LEGTLTEEKRAEEFMTLEEHPDCVDSSREGESGSSLKLWGEKAKLLGTKNRRRRILEK